MQGINYFENDNNINSSVIITAFFDINRGEWLHSKRSSETYLNSFKQMLISNIYKKMIIFIEFENYNKIINYLDDNKIIIQINKEWLITNCESWKKIIFQTEIMNSVEYKTKVQKRINSGNIENIYSEYNTINHSKIDFIKYSIDNNLINENELICWCDFGYYNSILHNNPDEFPQTGLDLNKFNLDKLNFCLRNKITKNDYDMNYTLINAPEVFTGSFFAGSTKIMLLFYELYHICLDELYLNNISDDDQHVYLRCYLKNNDIFELFLSENKWPQALTYFQKNN
jgi:hypothetical protein